MKKTLMPPSASNLEIAFDLVAAKHIQAIPVERILDQWHPQRCPAALLGWLAWAASVDDWNADWPEQVKRDVIESSIQVHRYKGTVYSVKRALASLAVQTNIIENTDTPHRFTVSALANETFASGSESVLDEHFYQLVKQQVNNNKPVRSHFDIQIGANFNYEICIDNQMNAAQLLQKNANAQQAPIASSSVFNTAALLQTSEITREHLIPKATTNLNSAEITIATTSALFVLVQFSMEIL